MSEQGKWYYLDNNTNSISTITPTIIQQERSIIKGKGIPVTGRGGPQVCETSNLPYFEDNRLRDGDYYYYYYYYYYY
jgi:hypothetical protein